MRQFLKKHGVLVSYVLWGCTTTVVNLGTYFLCTEVFHINYLHSNTAAWILSVLFAFFINKSMVFHSDNWKMKALIPQLSKFVGVRVFSFACETLLLWLCVAFFGFSDGIIKLTIDVFVVIFNYICSRLYVFE